MNQQSCPSVSRRAFTLIEVLVVVAIIALLVAILLPSLARARAQARNTVCVANLHGFGLAMTAYSTTHKGQFPGEVGAESAGWTWIVAKENGLKKKANIDNDPVLEGYATLNVHQLDYFQCPERESEMPVPFLDYVHNTLNPEGPSRSTEPSDAGQIVWKQPVMNIETYKFPAKVAYILDAEREEKNLPFSNPSVGSISLKQARENFYKFVSGEQTAEWLVSKGSLDVMDVRLGVHLPQGKGGGPQYNTSDQAGYRRIARKMHLDRFTNAMYVDGHAGGIQLYNGTDLDNYTYWLRNLGIQDPVAAAAKDPVTGR